MVIKCHKKKLFILSNFFLEIAILSPLIHQIMKTFENWMQLILVELNTLHNNGPPENYFNMDSKTISNDATSTINFNGPKILKYQSLLDPENTPFMYL